MDWLSDLVTRHGLWVGGLAVFLGGLALNLTPCVYPMIPVTLAFFSQQAAGRWSRAGLLAVCYVLGLSITYAILGVIAAKTGILFGAWLQHPLVLAGIAAVIVWQALGMFGLYDLTLPQVFTRRAGAAPAAGLWGAFGMGMVVGVIAAPCIGPFVVALLLVVSQLANPFAGFVLFFLLGLGMGLPYLLLGVAAHRVTHLPKSGPWLLWSKKILGAALLGLALYFVRSLIPPVLLTLAVAAWLIGAGVYLGWLEPSQAKSRRFIVIRRALGIGCVLAALAVVGSRLAAPRHDAPGVAWRPYTASALAQAIQEHRPVVIDVYADWCVPCVEMDHVTFRHPDVVAALGAVTTLRVDATGEVSADADALFDRYRIYGVPTILFVDRTGRERADLRLAGFTPPDEFLARLAELQ